MSKCVRAILEVFFSLLAGVAVLPQAEASDYDSAALHCMKHWNFALQFTKALVL